MTKLNNNIYLGNATSLRQAKPVYVWTQTEVCKWLRRHIPPSQAKVTDIFAEHDITGTTYQYVVNYHPSLTSFHSLYKN